MTSTIAVVGAQFQACATLADAIVVGLRLNPAWEVADVIVQDEFTHDVVFARAGGGAAIVLDCT